MPVTCQEAVDHLYSCFKAAITAQGAPMFTKAEFGQDPEDDNA